MSKSTTKPSWTGSRKKPKDYPKGYKKLIDQAFDLDEKNPFLSEMVEPPSEDKPKKRIIECMTRASLGTDLSAVC